MELIYFVLLFGAFSSVSCSDTAQGDLPLKVYGAVLIGLTMFIMLLIIIYLGLALYMLRNGKSFLGLNFNGQPSYLRQESSQGVTLNNVTSHKNLCDQNRNDGSTLTVNSGIIEISGGYNEPETPTRLEENKSFKNKLPLRSPIPTIQKAQMDDLIREVLNRKQKSDSVTLRELDALSSQKNEKVKHDNIFKRNSASLEHLDAMANASDDDNEIYQNASSIIEMMNEVEKKPKHEMKKSPLPKIKIQKDLVDGMNVPELQSSHMAGEYEPEVYDTLPNPVRCQQTGAETDEYIENLPLYDMPPRRSWENAEGRNVVIDPDTQYVLPLSTNLTQEQEKTCYVNAIVNDCNARHGN